MISVTVIWMNSIGADVMSFIDRDRSVIGKHALWLSGIGEPTAMPYYKYSIGCMGCWGK